MTNDTINWDAIDLFLKNGGHLEIESTDNRVDIYAVKDGEQVVSSYENAGLYDSLEDIGCMIKRMQS